MTNQFYPNQRVSVFNPNWASVKLATVKSVKTFNDTDGENDYGEATVVIVFLDEPFSNGNVRYSAAIENVAALSA